MQVWNVQQPRHEVPRSLHTSTSRKSACRSNSVLSHSLSVLHTLGPRPPTHTHTHTHTHQESENVCARARETTTMTTPRQPSPCTQTHAQTLNTLSAVIVPKPEYVACRLLSACRMSPCDEKIIASSPSSVCGTFSACATSTRRFSSCASGSLEYRRIAHLLWIASMILSAHQKRNGQVNHKC